MTKLNLTVSGSVLAAVLAASMMGCQSAQSDPTPDLHDDVSLVLRGPLFQSEVGGVIRDGVVVVSGDGVACSGPEAACSYPDDAPVARVEGGTILPGLIDLHVHSRPAYVGAFVPSGVTTIRDANNSLAVVDSLRTAPGGPRIAASGPLLDGPGSTMRQMSPTAGGIGDFPLDALVPILVRDAATAAAAVDSLADAGVDLIKLYQSLPAEAFYGAVRAARERDLPVAVDIGTVFAGGMTSSGVDIVEAAEAGVTSLEHLSGLALAYQRRGGDPLSAPYDQEILREIAADLLATDAAAVPTLATFEQFVDPAALSWSDVPGSHLAPFFEARWEFMLGLAEAHASMVRADRNLTRELLRHLREGGMMIGAGSDSPGAPGTVPGGGLHLELEALVRAGLTPAESLQAATINAGRILGRPDLGTLQPGARADIVVVAGDPTRDITATRQVQRVWYAGTEIDLDSAWAETGSALRRAFGSQ